MRKFNFAAGPATLPLSVLEKLQKDFVDYKGIGLSLVEATHRGKDYEGVHDAALALTRELLGIKDTHTVLFLQGGATLQFAMVPYNLLAAGKTASYTMTGAWAKKAASDAKKIGKIEVAWDGAAGNFTALPAQSELKVNPEAVYLHLTSNETIGGIQWQYWPDTGKVPIVADMSSDMMSRPLPMEKFGLIYAGAQKNLGPAGMTVVIIRNDLLEQSSESLVAYLGYKTHAKENSLYNTPPVFCVWAYKLVCEWLKENGGLDAAQERAEKKASLVYGAIDASDGYYRCPVSTTCRSRMNLVWRLPTEDLEKKFVSEASAKGMVGLKGHRSVGGIRASIYNAMPIEGVEALVSFMNDFRKANA